MKAGWEIKPISEITKTSAGGTPKTTTRAFYDGGSIPWLLSGEVGKRSITEATNFITEAGLKGSSAKLFPPRSVLVAMYGATAGEVGVLEFEASTNQAVCAILPGPLHEPDFVYYYLLHAKPQLVSQAVGNAQPNISQAKIKSLPIPLPPLEEQQRIVAILDEAFEGLDRAKANVEANLASARELFERQAAAAFQPLESEGETSQVTVEELALAEKGSIRTGPFGSQLLHSEFVDDGIAVLGIDNAVSNRFEWRKRRYITQEKYRELQRYTVRPGDVVITIMGTCGRCAVIPDDIPTAINSKHLCCISLDKEKCMPEFLHGYFLHSPTARAYLDREASGSVMDGLNMGIVKRLPVYLPSLGEQADIVSRIAEIEIATGVAKANYDEDLVALEELRQSLLAKAFAGELT